MPDGDIIRLGILGQYCTAYQQICEGVASKDCARALARGLRSRIEWYGSGVRELLKRMSDEFAPLLTQSVPIQVNQLAQLDKAITHERRKLCGRKEGLDIASDVCKMLLHRVQRGDTIADVRQELARLFVKQVLERTYDARVAAVQQHLDDTPFSIIQDRRLQIDDDLARYIDYFIKQISSGDSTKKLRLPPTRGSRAGVTPDDIVE